MIKKNSSIYRLLVLTFAVNIIWIGISYIFLTSIPNSHPLLRAYSGLSIKQKTPTLYIVTGKLGAELRSDCSESATVVSYMAEGSVVVGTGLTNVTEHVANIEINFPYIGWLCRVETSSRLQLQRFVHVKQVPTPALPDRRLYFASAYLISSGLHQSVEGLNGRTRSSWMDQWPVGNGKIGALVGGSLFSELLPVSVADFYVISATSHKPPISPVTSVTEKGVPDLVRRDREMRVQQENARRRVYRRETRDPRTAITPLSSSSEEEAEGFSGLQAFHRSRKSLLAGDFESSSRLLSETLLTEELGRFEGLFDLTLLYFPYAPQSPHRNSASTSSSLSDGPHHNINHKRRGVMRGRSDVLLDFLTAVSGLHPLDKSFSPADGTEDMDTAQHRSHEAKEPEGNAKPLRDFGSVLYERSFLNTATGIASSSYVAEAEKLSPLSRASPRLHVHQREWFTSEVDDVLVGTTSCAFIGEIGPDEGCLNVHLRLGREMRNRQEGSPGATIPLSEKAWQTGPWRLRRRLFSKDGAAEESSWLAPLLGEIDIVVGEESLRPDQVMAFGMSVQPGDGSSDDGDQGKTGVSVEHPGAEVCGVIICSGPSKARASAGSGRGSSEGRDLKFLTCSSGSEMTIITAVVSGSDHLYGSSPNEHPVSETSMLDGVEAMRSRCWGKVEAAVSLGPTALKRRHSDAFSARMAQSAMVVFESSDGEELRPGEGSSCAGPSELLRTQQSCLREALKDKDSDKEASETVMRLVTSAFGFSKYLLVSSASRSVANLQGLWADGPESAWNGDHHININQQMAYWPAHAMGLGATVAPSLTRFIEDLAREGTHTARQMYGCDGWVSHGFTDNMLNGGVRAGLLWSLCVTCGGWMALHLWDQLTYTMNTEKEFELFLHSSFLPVFRSLSTFYIDYMFEGADGHMHTGPTTSPENSFRFERRLPDGSKIQGFQQVALSPAFDMSVLRQVANAFRMAVEWAEHQFGSYEGLSADKLLSAKFTATIKRMKYAANPAISVASGRIVEFPVNVWRKGQVSRELPASVCPADIPAESPGSGSTSVEESSLSGSSTDVCLSEDFDLGHRHFSNMHWLYPGMFHPFGSSVNNSIALSMNESLFAAARKTLHDRALHLSGHTGWSAAWEACLWARLSSPQEFWQSFSRVLADYSAPNLMGLHPALEPSPLGEEGCDTCFSEANGFRNQNQGSSMRLSEEERLKSRQISDEQLSHKRGMVTEFGGVFQLDANMGYGAALLEAIVQSHYSGSLVLFPALPSALKSGQATGIVVRGGVRVSLSWREGFLRAGLLMFHSWHPWLEGMREEGGAPGYFRSGGGAGRSRTWVRYSISSPNPIVAMKAVSFISWDSPSPSPRVCRWRVIPVEAVDMEESPQPRHHVVLSVDSSGFPCVLPMCPAESFDHQTEAERCGDEIKRFLMTSRLSN